VDVLIVKELLGVFLDVLAVGKLRMAAVLDLSTYWVYNWWIIICQVAFLGGVRIRQGVVRGPGSLRMHRRYPKN
jgi:hypothetical protein